MVMIELFAYSSAKQMSILDTLATLVYVHYFKNLVLLI